MRNRTPNRPRAPRFHRARAHGLGLVELLVSLSITSLLLVGVASAFVASAQAVEMNDQFTRATQSARLSIGQITTQARQCQKGVLTDTTSELTMTDGSRRLYALDAVKHELQVTLFTNPPEVHTLARNVDSLHFLTDGTTVNINVVITVGDNSVRLSGSALPRRMVKYE